jgi:hypothetical protein
MAKEKNYFSNFDTPYEVQPPKGAAEGPIQYGGVTNIPEAKDPMGVLPPMGKEHNIGPRGGEG